MNGLSASTDIRDEDKWIVIQQTTFTNWVNEQLNEFSGGRSIKSLATDLCDGVNLVALVESLQFKKIGKVYGNPKTRIQMIQNVSLACKAITEDNVKLVNIGNEDIVNGNLKLILGLIWHLIMRYQISSRKTKAPPKKLMLTWFQSQLPDFEINNFTDSWTDGIALHALMESLKPGTFPEWRKLHSKNKVENCRSAMIIAKEKFGIPRLLSPEHFASADLDELSAMTYLSYFVKVDSPGYYGTLNWVCQQLRTAAITNLTTDWNDGYNMCAVVHSLGANVPNWPDLNREDREGNCQKALDGGKQLGVEPTMTAKEMSDPNIDHLSMMAYLSKLQNVEPLKADNEKFTYSTSTDDIILGKQMMVRILPVEDNLDHQKLVVEVKGPHGKIDHDLSWASNKQVTCRFTPRSAGQHKIDVKYNGVLQSFCPLEIKVHVDMSKVKLLTSPSTLRVGTQTTIEIELLESGKGSLSVEQHDQNGNVKILPVSHKSGNIHSANFVPKSIGVWEIHAFYESEEIAHSPIEIDVYDPQKVWVSGQHKGIVEEDVSFRVNYSEAGTGEVSAKVTHKMAEVRHHVVCDEINKIQEIKFVPLSSGEYVTQIFFNGIEVTGSPKIVDVVDPGQIVVIGDGISRGILGKDCKFEVITGDLGGNIDVRVTVENQPVSTIWHEVIAGYEFSFKPDRAGIYTIDVEWDGRVVAGSPFQAKITDRSRVVLLSDLKEDTDENGYLALTCGKDTKLNFDILNAGPGSLNAEILAPSGKLPVNIQNITADEIEVSFKAKEEGDHYIHLYWSELPLDFSPLLAYCPGPILPLDAQKVMVTGPGCTKGRSQVPAEFMIDGKLAGPGIPRVILKGIKNDPEVEVKAMKYDRYKCRYVAPNPGSYLLYVYWSNKQVPGAPFKVTIGHRGTGNKVAVTGQGLKGGFVGQELRVIVNTIEAGYGDIKANFLGKFDAARCDILDQENGCYTLRMFPTEATRHKLEITYDGEDVPGSPFTIPVGEPPDPRKVKVYGPGIEPGLIMTFESKFIVETYGAGAGTLAVRVRGPKGAFHVDMKRERENDRTILCQYNPQEPGSYIVSVKWSGKHVNGSPFPVNIYESRSELKEHLRNLKGEDFIMADEYNNQWQEEV